MKRWLLFTLFPIVLLVLLFASPSTGWSGTHSNRSYTPAPRFGETPLYFIPNRGQVDGRALFYARTPGYTLWMTRDGMVFDGYTQEGKAKSKKRGRDVSRLLFLNANNDPQVKPGKAADYRVNFMEGRDKRDWLTQIPSSSSVYYSKLYKDIDLKIYGVQKKIEYDWIIHPGGNPDDILIRYDGIKSSKIDQRGNLRIHSARKQWLHRKPVAYQTIAGKRVPVSAGFRKSKHGNHCYGFMVGNYDRNYPLVIDPMVKEFATFLGGGGYDSIRDITLGAGNTIYATGSTESGNFPVANGYQQSLSGPSDAFVSKFSADGASLIFSTYIGGSSYDWADAIALGTDGSIYIGGRTGSTDFPVLNAYQSVSGGDTDSFAARLSADGSSLIYATYLGGSQYDYINGIDVDSSGAATVAGVTVSADFPLHNALQPSFNNGGTSGYDDAFVAKFSATGDSLVYSTYLGGGQMESANVVKVDSGGTAYIAGRTSSSDFPTANPYQSSFGGNDDGFICALSADGSALVFSTYLGGSGLDDIYGLTRDSSGAIYVCGNTGSSNFPVTAGVYLTSKPEPGTDDGFITKLNASGSALVYSTYLGGSGGYTYARDLAALSDGSIAVTGNTSSSNFPLLGQFDEWMGMYGAAFITHLNAAGSDIHFSTLLGAMDSIYANTTAVNANGDIYVAGDSDDGFRTYYGYQNTYGGGQADGFLVKLVASDITGLTLDAPNGGEVWTAGTTQNIIWTAPDTVRSVNIYYSWYDGWDWISETIAEGAPNTGTYAWTIPNIDVWETRIFIQDTESGSGMWDESDDYFRITNFPITLTAPKEGDWLEAGTVFDITWVDNGQVATVSLDYTTDWTTYYPIATSIPSTGLYSWTIPNTPGTQWNMRITVDATGMETYAGPFTIAGSVQPAISVVTPNGTESLVMGNSYDITWSDNGQTANVVIDYSVDNGTTWKPVTASIPNTNSYIWTVPDDYSRECLVRVTDATSAASDVSDGVFSILAPPLPQAQRDVLIAFYNATDGDNWTKNTNWRKPGDDTQFNDPGTEHSWHGVSVTADYANVYKLVIGNNNLNGTLPNLSNLSQLEELRVGQSPLLGGNIPDTLNNLTQLHTISMYDCSFNGSPPDLSALSLLTWLDLRGNNLSGSIPAWLTNLPALTFCGLSDNWFTGELPDLSSMPVIESLLLHDNNLGPTIPTWLTTMTTLKSLGLGGNNFANPIPDFSPLTNLTGISLHENNLTGTVPSWINNMTWITSIALHGNQFSGTVPVFPNITELRYLQLQNNQFTGNIPDFSVHTKLNRLDLSGNHLDGQLPDSIGQITTLSYLLLKSNKLTGPVPASFINLTSLSHFSGLDMGWNALHTNDQTLLDFLNSRHAGDFDNFQTVAPENVATANAAETSIEVTWTPIDFSSYAGGYRVYYTTTPGSGYTLAGETADKTIGQFTVSGLASGTTYYFLVETFTSPNSNNSNEVVSEASAEISGSTILAATISVQSPNGGQLWEGGTPQTITWITTGTVNDVKIEYSTDTGGSWNTVTDSTPNNGSHGWVIPNSPSANCLIKISDVANAIVSDTSDAAFTILEQRTITVTAPDNGETWYIGVIEIITWNSTGAISTVSIDYSIDNGSSWNPVIASTANTGTYPWTIPNTPSTQCLVRISDTAGPATDTSNAVFTIPPPQISSVERDALIAFYNSTGGDNYWFDNSNWKKPGDPTQFNDPGTENTWLGVTCNAENTHVIGITINMNGLYGTLPAELNNLTYLKTLDLYYGQLSGTVPDLSGTPLEILNLGKNGYSGNIPTNLANIATLKELTLSENQFDGPIPDLSALSNLEVLDMGWNQLTGNLPTWLDTILSLKNIALSNNQLDGTITDLSNLTNLERLHLRHNQFSGVIPSWIGQLTTLQSIDLSDNELTGDIPILSALVNLTNLSLSDNQLTGTIPDVSGAANMFLFNLSGNQLTQTIPPWINNFTQLYGLYLSRNQLTGDIPPLNNLTALNGMNLSNNQLTGSIPDLVHHPNLETFFLHNNQLSGDIPSSLSNLTQLTMIQLNDNQITGSIPPLDNLTAMYWIDLSDNHLSGSIPAGIGNMPNLYTLRLDSNKIIGELPGSMINLTGLRDGDGLNVKYNGLYTDDDALANFLTGKQGSNIRGLQTVPPKALTVSEESHDSIKISWQITSYTSGSGGYRVYYSTTSGSGYTLAGKTADKTIDNFTVTGLSPATTYYFVVDCISEADFINDNDVISDYSEEVSGVTIETPTITVTAPNGGQTWDIGTIQAIIWNSTGSIANVQLEYSTDNGGSWNSIESSISNGGSYNWTIPNNPSTTCLVKVSDTAGSASDASNAVFTIAVPLPPAPVADFSADVTTVTEGDTVVFTDLSSNSPTSWNWTFNGGTPTSSTQQHPNVVYNTEGTYPVTLEATNAGGTGTETKTGYITVLPPEPAMETGVVTNVGDTWQTVTLSRSYTSMVVVCANNLGGTGLPAVTRIRNASGNSFQVKVQNPGDANTLVGYKVHYLVMEEGVYTVAEHGIKMEAVKVNSTLTAENNNWATEARTYANSYTNPVVVGQVMTHNDPNWSVFWASGAARSNPPVASAFYAGKHVGEDSITTRANETIGYIVIEQGSGTINGIPYAAALGADIVRGPDNTSTGYVYTYGNIASPSCAIVSSAAIDGGNGGWPVLYGSNPLTSTQLILVYDEDQINDSERKHTGEQVAYIVFGQ